MNDDLKHHVCFNQGTEPPFTGKYVDHKEDGTYTCTMCNTPYSNQTPNLIQELVGQVFTMQLLIILTAKQTLAME